MGCLCIAYMPLFSASYLSPILLPLSSLLFCRSLLSLSRCAESASKWQGFSLTFCLMSFGLAGFLHNCYAGFALAKTHIFMNWRLD